jgi:hypothetical protein
VIDSSARPFRATAAPRSFDICILWIPQYICILHYLPAHRTKTRHPSNEMRLLAMNSCYLSLLSIFIWVPATAAFLSHPCSGPGRALLLHSNYHASESQGLRPLWLRNKYELGQNGARFRLTMPWHVIFMKSEAPQASKAKLEPQTDKPKPQSRYKYFCEVTYMKKINMYLTILRGLFTSQTHLWQQHGFQFLAPSRNIQFSFSPILET